MFFAVIVTVEMKSFDKIIPGFPLVFKVECPTPVVKRFAVAATEADLPELAFLLFIG